MFGYGKLDFILNLGIDYYCFYFHFVGIGLVAIFYTCRKNKNLKFVYNYLFDKFCHNYILRLLLESYLNIGFCCVVSFYQLVNYKSTVNYLSMISSLILAASLTFYPVFILLIIKIKKEKPDFKAKFGALVEDIKDTSIWSLMFHLIFVVRR